MIAVPPIQNVILLVAVLVGLPLLVTFDSDIFRASCTPVYRKEQLTSISYMIISPSALGAMTMALVPLSPDAFSMLLRLARWQIYVLFVGMFFTIVIPTTYNATLHQVASYTLLGGVIYAGWDLPITREYRNAVLLCSGLTVSLGVYHTYIQHIGGRDGTWLFYIGESAIALLIVSAPYNLTEASQAASPDSHEVEVEREREPSGDQTAGSAAQNDRVASHTPRHGTLVIHHPPVVTV